MMTHPTTRTAPPRRRSAHVLLWTAQIVLAAVFIYVAALRLTGASTSVQTFEKIGLGQWLRYLTGVVELAGGIGLLIPRVAGAAALGLVGVMIGATIANLLVLTPALTALTIALGITSALVAWARRAEIRSLLDAIRR
jgi:putative oxidoreductase